MNRIMNVVRMQTVNKMTFIGIPLIIIGGAFLLALLVMMSIPTTGVKYLGGASQAAVWYFLALGIYARTLTFPFALALSATRREFYLGSLVIAGLSAIALGLVYGIGAAVEGATDGWGMNGYYFRIPGLSDSGGPAVTGLLYGTLVLLLFVLGFLFGSVFKRWGSTALTLSLVGLGVALVGIILLISWTHTWPQVVEAFITLGATGFVFVLLGVSLVMSVVAFLPLRRSTV